MSGPLKGIKVIDLTQAMAGPCCAMILGDFGADVIKVEPPKNGDMLRFWGPPFQGGIGSYFLMFNRNKKAITLDLRKPEGLEIFYELTKDADIVIESFRPGVKKKLKIDYETLSQNNPKLIYTSISGFGQTGPYANRPGFDPIAQGMSGIMASTGTDETGPVKVGMAIGDYFTGVYAALGTALALFHRQVTGQGQHLDASLLETLVSSLGVQASTYLATKERPAKTGNMHPTQSPYGSFKTKEGYINIAAGNQGMWERLCQAIDAEHLLTDDRFGTVADRVNNRDALTIEVEKGLAAKTSLEWIDILEQAGVAAGPILEIDQVFQDPQVLHQNMLLDIPHPELGLLQATGFAVNLTKSAAEVTLPPPLLGQHNEEILGQMGYGPEDLAALAEKGVI